MSRGRVPAGSMGAAFLLAVAAPALSQGRPDRSDPRYYELDWALAPHAVPDGDFWVREQAQVVETRLLPTELWIAEGPVTAAGGAVLMAAGQQVVRLRATRPMVCNVRPGARGTRASGKRVCLIDTDNDGSFDSYFERGMGGDYWFALAGQLPEQLERLAPGAAFRTAPATEMTGTPSIGLHYQRILDGGLTLPVTNTLDGRNVMRFHFKVGGEGQRRQWMIRHCASPTLPSYCASALFPSQFRFGGLVVDLLERRGEDIRIRVTAPFDGTAVYFQDIDDGHNSGEMFVAGGTGS